MKRDQLIFLLCGLAFGFLLGWGFFASMENRPEQSNSGASVAAGKPAPAGGAAMPGPPPAAAQGGAPMLEEIAALKKRVREHPDDLAAASRLANLYHDVQMYDQAIPYYEKALEIRPDDPNLMTDLGFCLQAIGKYDPALELFARSHEVDPTHWQSLYNTVVVAGLTLHRFDVAEAALAELRRVRPDAPNLDQLRHALDQARQTGGTGGQG